MSAIFDTSYARANQDTLRWASVAIAAVLFLCCLIAGVVIYTKPKFRADLQAPEGKSLTNDAVTQLSSGTTVVKLIIVAFFWLIVLVSTFLSWYIAALHMQKNNLIALDVFNVVIFIMLGLAAYFYYKDGTELAGISRMMVGSSAVLELIVIILLLASSTASGSDGQVSSASLYVPLFISTLALMARY